MKKLLVIAIMLTVCVIANAQYKYDANYSMLDFDSFMEKAKTGDVDAMYKVGYCYYWSKGCSMNDRNKAFEWLAKAANQGDVRAEALLAACYEKGRGVAKSEKMAFIKMLSAANKGNRAAVYWLSDYYEEGIGTVKNYAKAMNWHKKGADLGYSEFLHYLGVIYEYGKLGQTQNGKLALSYFTKAVNTAGSNKDNYANALNSLGCCYSEGIGTFKDPWKAFDYFKKSAEAGNTYAMRNLADCYENGEGTQKNYTEAMKWLKKGADLGAACCLGELGLIYHNGECGQRIDDKLALSYLEKAVNADDAEDANIYGLALYELGKIYYHHYSVYSDLEHLEKANECFKKSVKAGYSEAQSMLDTTAFFIKSKKRTQK